MGAIVPIMGSIDKHDEHARIIRLAPHVLQRPSLYLWR